MKAKRGKDTLWEAFFEHESSLFPFKQNKQAILLTKLHCFNSRSFSFHCQQSTQNGFACFKQSFQIVDAGHVAVLVTLI